MLTKNFFGASKNSWGGGCGAHPPTPWLWLREPKLIKPPLHELLLMLLLFVIPSAASVALGCRVAACHHRARGHECIGCVAEGHDGAGLVSGPDSHPPTLG